MYSLSPDLTQLRFGTSMPKAIYSKCLGGRYGVSISIFHSSRSSFCLGVYGWISLGNAGIIANTTLAYFSLGVRTANFVPSGETTAEITGSGYPIRLTGRYIAGTTCLPLKYS